MVKFKECTIVKLPLSSLPHLHLKGQWLDKIDFAIGTTVNVVYYDSCLTFTTEKLEPLATPLYTTTVLTQYMGKHPKKPRPKLCLNGLILKKYGFRIGDRVGVIYKPNMIQITNITHFTYD